MNRDDLQNIARLRVKEAKALIKAGHYSGAYYLLGYAVECALKACIAKKTLRYDFPDKTTVRDSYTHDLVKLFKISDLEFKFRDERRTNAFLDNNWAIVKDWTEHSRYDATIQKIKAKDFYSAVTARKYGVLSWLKNHW